MPRKTGEVSRPVLWPASFAPAPSTSALEVTLRSRFRTTVAKRGLNRLLLFPIRQGIENWTIAMALLARHATVTYW